MPNGFCEICQHEAPTKVISNNEICSLHISSREWELGVNLLAGDPMPTLHTTDGCGCPLSRPMTTREACERGIALFE